MSTQSQWGLLNSRHYALTLGCLIYKMKSLPTTLNWITQIDGDKCAIEIKSQEKFSNCTFLGGQEFAK